MRTRVVTSMIVLVALAFASPAQEFTGAVVAVFDGDMLSVMHGDVAEFVYLYGVDCPEQEQPFGPEAAQFVAELVNGKTLTIKPIDPAEREAASAPVNPKLARPLLNEAWLETVTQGSGERQEDRLYANVVLDDGTVLNYRLLEEGLAWWDPIVAPREGMLKKLNAQALAVQEGLWADPAPLAPWDFRKRQAEEAAKAKETGDPAAGVPAGLSQQAVFITKTGARYHKYGCHYLDKTAKVITRGKAESRGYSPCQVCFPEVLNQQEGPDIKAKGDGNYAPEPLPALPAAPKARQSPVRRPAAPFDMPRLDFAGPLPRDLTEMALRHRPRTYRDASGNPAGITADAISAVPYASAVGLRDGDVVQGVNGVRINSIPEAMGLVKQFRNTKQFDISILRNGKPSTLRLSLP